MLKTTANSSGSSIGELRYKAWGEQRYSSGTTYTNRRYTGQLRESSLGGVEGMYYFNARWVDVSLGRFTQPDSIIPEPGNPQAWDRFAYGLNNPVKYIDPSGHRTCTAEEAGTGNETCDQNIVNDTNWTIHRVLLDTFRASNPQEAKFDLPSSDPITNTWVWVINLLGVVGDFLPASTNNASNVYMYLTYSEFQNGSIDDFSLSVVNYSDQNVNLASVIFSSERWSKDVGPLTTSCVECGDFSVMSNISNYLAVVPGNSKADVSLSTYPSNPSVSISPDYNFPPFSGAVNVTISVYMYANTLAGFSFIPLQRYTIWGPR